MLDVVMLQVVELILVPLKAETPGMVCSESHLTASLRVSVRR